MKVMATSTEPQHPSAAANELAANSQFVFVGLVWGTVMRGTRGFWQRAKYGVAGVFWANVFLFAAACAAVLALWQAFALWIKKESADQKTAALLQQRRILSMIFMAAGLGLIVMAFILGIGKKPGPAGAT